ncbi:MAG: hypothetical protein EXS48_01565 [Candidatus Staskawiczbacteria bacterium]|nr:hypothetical protein [Candidatus Staskawiczbacteria bacterium]
MKAKKKQPKKIKKSVKDAVKKAVKKPKKLLIIKKTKLKSPEQDFLAGSFFKAKIKVIGIGGGGGSIVSQISRSLGKASFVVADTDMRAFKKKAGIKNFLFGQKLTHGLGTGVNPQLGRQAAELEKERIAHFFADQDIVIFIASLGGGLGSGATQIFAEAVKDFNGITFGIFTLPFKFEGDNKYKIAVKALHQLRRSLNVSITIPNEKIFKIIDQDTAITDAFSMVNKNLIESLESLIDLIYNPGIINIDFADLRAILSGKGNLAFLNTIDASGKNRAQTIAEKILHNPLYQNNNFIAEKILFNIAGGDNLNMFEVDKISKAISLENPKAKIIFGISKNIKYKNKVKATVLMTGPGKEIKVPEVKVVPKVEKKSVVKVMPKIFTKKKPVIKNKKNKKKFVSLDDILMPAFNKIPFINGPAELNVKRLNIVEAGEKDKKAIRRNAMEIKKDEEQKESGQSVQEKEWEIPAFLRLKK